MRLDRSRRIVLMHIDVAQLLTRVKSDILEPLVILGLLFTSIHRLLGYVPVSQLDWFVHQYFFFLTFG
jgi:hypothetical protein